MYFLNVYELVKVFLIDNNKFLQFCKSIEFIELKILIFKKFKKNGYFVIKKEKC